MLALHAIPFQIAFDLGAGQFRKRWHPIAGVQGRLCLAGGDFAGPAGEAGSADAAFVDAAFVAAPGCVGIADIYMQLAKLGVEPAIRQSAPLASAANICRGKVTNQAVAETFGLKFEAINDL